jgi:hypothetical protein|eukprot:COSAG06_NODE_177_length_21031_cov_13.839528_2_plen_70_part_00
MLETGNGGWAKGSNQSDVEYRTEFSMWAILASPMVVTTPLNNMHGAGNGFFEPFLHENDQFAKTGSGQA